MKENQEFIMKPKVDFCFKELMGVEQVRNGFIAALLGITANKIESTVLLPTHLEKEYQGDKLGILDVRVQLMDGTQVDMEIQIAPFALWPERSLFYLSKMYAGQIKEGEEYEELQKCIHVGILNFVLFNETESYYSCFHLWEDKRHQLYTDKLEVHILELPKLTRHDYPENELLDWARFINAEHREELEEMAEKNEYLGKAYEKLVNISADEEKRLEYEAREKAIRDHNYLMKTNLKLGFEEGRREGHREGFGEGEERMSRLIQSLAAEARIDDMKRAAENKAYREELFKEFNL